MIGLMEFEDEIPHFSLTNLRVFIRSVLHRCRCGTVDEHPTFLCWKKFNLETTNTKSDKLQFVDHSMETPSVFVTFRLWAYRVCRLLS